ncbi:MAG: DUF4440 domain-containing protein [Saprospiraceae bacterium]|nr:DUF4440 domain-containing protein [Saprospiraceae bacterium]
MTRPLFLTLTIALCAITITTGQNTESSDQSLQALLAADRAWAKAAEEGNMKVIEDSWTEDAIMIVSGRPPLYGKARILERVRRSRQDPNFAISWSVEGGAVSASGDMGYTYGSGSITMTGDNGKPVTATEPYLVVWRKGADGKWRGVIEK